jgi:hypothetical protein
VRQMLRILFSIWIVISAGSVALAADPPVALCNNVTVEADANCMAMANINDGSYDPSGELPTLVQVPAGPYPLGETLVKLIVVAASGLADTCEATVTVIDKTPPVVVCPADIVVGNDPGQCGASVSYDITATDNCSITSPLGKQRASFYPVGVTMITPVVTDASGNEGSCSFKVIVKDTERPTINCPADIVQGTDLDICGALVNYVTGASDNCSGVTMSTDHPSGTIFPVGVTTVWLKAKDASENQDSCSFTVTINDTQKPHIICPADIVQSNDPGECDAVVNYEVTATDNCDTNPVIELSTPSGSRWSVGSHQVMATATDVSGNADTCYFSVQVNDTEGPHVTCPDDIVIDNDPGACGAYVGFLVTGYDNCSFSTKDIQVSPPSGSFFPIGQTEVTAIGTDRSGNADTCTFLVTVNDTEKPEIDCPIDIVRANDPGQCGATVGFKYFGDDNCPQGLTVVAEPPSGSLFGFGTTQVTITATDTSGNADTCYFNVTINDTEPPVAICPANIVETVALGDTGKVVNFTIDATDNCPGVSVVATPASGSFFLLGTTPVVVKATDAVGLVDSCVFNVEVKLGLNPDFAVDAHPDTIIVMAGIGDSLLYFIDLTAIDGYSKPVVLTVSSLPTDVVLDFGLDTLSVPNSTTLGGHTGNGTPAGEYELTITATEATAKAGPHNTKVWLIVNPCTATPIPVVSTDIFNVQVEEGQNLAFDSLFVTNAAPCGTLAWFAASDQPWVWADPYSGSVPGGALPGSKVFLQYNTTSLTPGDYVAHITIQQAPPKSITNNPTPYAEVTINLTVNPKPPVYCVSGTVMDVGHNLIAGATVELYEVYPPSGVPIATTVSDEDGYYELCPPPAKPATFTVRAFKAGYYPDYRETGLPETDFVLTLRPNGGNVAPTYEWVDLYCKYFAYFEGAPLLPGSVIEAYDPQGVLCGQWNMVQAGTYGFMPVYRNDPFTPGIDEGAEPGDLITVTVDGYVATMANGPIYWGTNGDRYQACFDVTPVPPYRCIPLKQGWNLISWNLDTPNDSIMILAKDVMDNVDVILGFERGALTYDPLLPKFSSLLYADHLHGFWFRMNAEDELCVEGPMVAASTPIDLEQNWNLVSYLPTVPFTVPVALASMFDKVVVVLGYDNGALTYDPAYPQFNNLEEMERDFGYWIKTTGSATLVYPGPVLAKATPSIRKSEFTPRTTQSNTWVNLYGYDLKLNDATLPVGTVIEAYDASGALVGESVVRNAGRFGFMPVYGAETLNGDAVGKSVGSTITLKVNGEVAEQTITWSGNGDRIRINELTTANKNNGNLPNAFTLNQNYPNPFNPETSIDYVVGKSSHVELAVYNTLGNRIKTLVSGYQPAGSYTIKWQADTDAGTSVASGVYFYKLTAGDYTDTKKMTLLK